MDFDKDNLEKYLKDHPPKGFKPIPTVSKVGNMIKWYFSDDPGYAETINVDGVNVGHLIRSFKTKEIVGVKIFLDGLPLTVRD